MSHYEALFTPFTLNGLELPNRIVMAPMTRSQSPGGVPTDEVAAYYRRRAEGGVGLIITEGTVIDDPAASNDPNVPRFHGEDALSAWQKVADEVHAAGGLIMPQIWHQGAMRDPGKGPYPDAPTSSPSGLKYPGRENSQPLSKAAVEDLVDAYARACGDAKKRGFDGAELHGAHGYLIDQFFWDGTNQRDDEWGGDMVARTKFAAEIIRAVRRETGADFPLIIRFSQWKQQDYESRLAQTPDQLKAFLQPMMEAGIDSFHCSTRRFWEAEFEGSDMNLAGWVKQLSGLPSITVGSVGLDGEFVKALVEGEEAAVAPIDRLVTRLEAGEFDLVAVGRILLSEPEWAHKIRDGRMDDITPYTRKAMETLI